MQTVSSDNLDVQLSHDLTCDTIYHGNRLGGSKLVLQDVMSQISQQFYTAGFRRVSHSDPSTTYVLV